MINYDENSKESIYNYAKKLKGKSFNNLLDERILSENRVSEESSIYENSTYINKFENNLRKGGLGDFLEKIYFDIDNNSESRPDFYKANLELKLTPFKKLKNGGLSAKERLVISMINYHNIVDSEFYESNLWHKIENILMIFYLWEKNIPRLDYKIYFIHMYSPSEEDLIIIKSDYYKIKDKVLNGKAHELSEGDTLYVGACTKSSNSSITTSQPFNEFPAKPRAFSFKSSYMTYILRNYVNSNNKKLDKIVDNNEFSDFESLVLNKLEKYYKRNELDLFKEFNIKTKAKQKYSLLTLKILGVKTNNAEEFQKANIEIKTIKHEPGKKPKESMSFPKYNIQTLVKKDWYDSDLYKLFSTKKFLFVEFLETEQGTILNSAKFWNMPYQDLNGDLKKEWEKYKNKYKEGINFKISGNKVKNDLPKMKDTRIIHSRPHSRKSAYYFKSKNLIIGNLERDADTLPNGDMITSQCFWLNNSYVYEQIKK